MTTIEQARNGLRLLERAVFDCLIEIGGEAQPRQIQDRLLLPQIERNYLVRGVLHKLKMDGRIHQDGPGQPWYLPE